MKLIGNNSINRRAFSFAFAGLFAGMGAALLLVTNAATNSVSLEAETSGGVPCGEIKSDSAASAGAYIEFGAGENCLVDNGNAGAQLPITYNLAAITGTVRFVSPDGNDASGAGTEAAPLASLSKAIALSASNDTIIVRGGTYRQGNVSTGSKTLKILAYPGELPIFSGAAAPDSGWSSEGGLRYHSYTPQPVTNGSGIDFIQGQNLDTGGMGKFPDQAWVGSMQLRQVSAKSEVAAGTFWVDAANGRLYITAVDAAQGPVEFSDKAVFMDIRSPGTYIEGIIVTRYSNSADDGGVINVFDTADGSVIKNIAVYDAAFIAMHYIGSNDLLENSQLVNVTIEKSNWMGISALYTNDLVMRAVKIRMLNQFAEFTHSPQSGALKTSRTRSTKVLNSVVTNNKSHGLWFDQSNLDVDVAANWIAGNDGSGVFFEISDDLLLINNYIEAPAGGQAVKLAGSSGLKLVNNTILGGGDPVGIYADARSKPGCADPLQPLCAESYSSDRDTVRALPATMDWMPRLDLLINNLIAYPARTQYCSLTLICVLSSNGTASAPLQTIFHPADASRGIPATVINGNVYANGTGTLVHTALGSYGSTAMFSAAMAAAPVYLPGLDAISKSGNEWVNPDGTATDALRSANDQAVAVPTDANINQYIPAGTKHYGVTYR